jgi:flagellar motor protein MotB
MSIKLPAILALALSCAAAVGCAGPDLQSRVDELTREQEDLQRQKAEVEADLLACRARCESLERGRQAAARPEPSGTPAEMPGDLQGKVDIRRRGNDTVIDIPSDVFFASGSSTLSREGDKAMSQVAAYIKRNHPSGLVRVEGHSDSDPIRRTKSKYHCNWELSFERAHAVMHYLVEKAKLDPHRVVCESYGEFHPQDPANKSKNRRVEIVIAR